MILLGLLLLVNNPCPGLPDRFDAVGQVGLRAVSVKNPVPTGGHVRPGTHYGPRAPPGGGTLAVVGNIAPERWRPMSALPRTRTGWPAVRLLAPVLLIAISAVGVVGL